jgi:hypothetical protein
MHHNGVIREYVSIYVWLHDRSLRFLGTRPDRLNSRFEQNKEASPSTIAQTRFAGSDRRVGRSESYRRNHGPQYGDIVRA